MPHIVGSQLDIVGILQPPVPLLVHQERVKLQIQVRDLGYPPHFAIVLLFIFGRQIVMKDLSEKFIDSLKLFMLVKGRYESIHCFWVFCQHLFLWNRTKNESIVELSFSELKINNVLFYEILTKPYKIMRKCWKIWSTCIDKLLFQE